MQRFAIEFLRLFSTGCRKAKTKQITTTNQKTKYLEDPMKSNQFAESAGKRGRPSRDSFQLCIWFIKRVARVFWSNHRATSSENLHPSNHNDESEKRNIHCREPHCTQSKKKRTPWSTVKPKWPMSQKTTFCILSVLFVTCFIPRRRVNVEGKQTHYWRLKVKGLGRHQSRPNLFSSVAQALARSREKNKLLIVNN